MAVSTSSVLVLEDDKTASSHKDCFSILSLPLDVIGRILNKLDNRTMANLELTSRFSRARHFGDGMRLTEQAARDAYEARRGPTSAGSLQSPIWKVLLHSVESLANDRVSLSS